MGTRWLSLCAAVTMFGCSTEPDPVTVGALTITTHDPTRIAGTYTDGLADATFEVVDRGAIEVDLTLGDLVVHGVYDQAAGTTRLSAPSVIFDQFQIDLVRALESELADALAADEPSAVDRVLVGFVSYLTDYEAGLAWIDVDLQAQRSIQGIGCGTTCRTLYRSCGGSYVKTTGIRSPNCKGRCGAGCGNARSGGWNVWSMDCAEHDYHLGPLGDCADDTAWGPTYSCGYSGSETCAGCNCSDGPSC